MENIATEETVLTEIIETCEKIIAEEATLEIGKEVSKELKLESDGDVENTNALITEEVLWSSPLLQSYIHERLNDSQLVQSADIRELAQCIGAKCDVVKNYLDLAYPYRSCFRVADISSMH